MRLLRRLRATSLLTRFAVVSLLVTVAVGAVLSSVLGDAIAERAREQAEATVAVTVRLGLQPQLRLQDLVNGFDPDQLARVERSVDAAAADLDAGRPTEDPIELKIFNRERTVVYHSENRDVIGTTSESGELTEALEGAIVSGFAHSADDSGASGSRSTSRSSTRARRRPTASWSSICRTHPWPPRSARTCGCCRSPWPSAWPSSTASSSGSSHR